MMFADVTVKSFVVGLCLTTALALLDSIAAPAAALCVLFPDVRAAAAVELAGDDCISACRASESLRRFQIKVAPWGVKSGSQSLRRF